MIFGCGFSLFFTIEGNQFTDLRERGIGRESKGGIHPIHKEQAL